MELCYNCSCNGTQTAWPRRCNSKWTCFEDEDNFGKKHRVVYRAKSKCLPFSEGDYVLQCPRSWHSESPSRRRTKKKGAMKVMINPLEPHMKPAGKCLNGRAPERIGIMPAEHSSGRIKKKATVDEVDNFYNRFKHEIRRDMAINRKIKKYSESSANKAYDIKFIGQMYCPSCILTRGDSEEE